MKSITVFLVFMINGLIFSQSIEQQLIVVQNDGILDGTFSVAVQVKGTNLSVANTLGSATIDVIFNNTNLSFVDGTDWAFNFHDGYSTGAVDQGTFIRIPITSSNIYSGAFTGFDIGSSYITWVKLNFSIANASGTASFDISQISNAIGLFENHQNNPRSDVITDQTLSAPVGITDEPLPVELVSFSAIPQDGYVKLNWETATEVDNYGFEIERTSPQTSFLTNAMGIPMGGEGGEAVRGWEKVGFVQGHGNSNSPKSYNFTDNKLIGGSKFVYRLKQIDIDGNYDYSDEIEVEIIPTEFAIYQNYPNPFNPNTKIRYQLPHESRVTIKLYDMLGSEISTLLNEKKEPGVYEVDFSAHNLSSGTYIYRIVTDGFVEAKKMILLK